MSQPHPRAVAPGRDGFQTSYLTPPFGFSLFFLRSVAPAEVKTEEIYRGAAPFVALQLMGLTLVILFPELVFALLRFFRG